MFLSFGMLRDFSFDGNIFSLSCTVGSKKYSLTSPCASKKPAHDPNSCIYTVVSVLDYGGVTTNFIGFEMFYV